MTNETNPITLSPEAMIAQLRAMRQQIPQYGQLTGAQRQSLQTAARVDPDFLIASINAAGESPIVENALGVTHDAFRQESSDDPVWQAVEEELRATLNGVSGANLIRRHRLGTLALQTYGITRLLVRRPEYANLLPHFQTMKRSNRFGKKRKTAAGSDPAPAPQPQPLPEPQPAPQQLLPGDTITE